MQFFKPYTTLAVGIVLGAFVAPKIIRMVRK